MDTSVQVQQELEAVKKDLDQASASSNRTSCDESKVQHPDFSSLTKGLDIIGVTETHSSSESEIQKQGYRHFAVVRKKAKLARSHSGGIAVLIKNHLAAHTTMCDWSNTSCLTIKIKGSVLHYEHDLYVITVYIPSEGSSYLKGNAIQTFEESYDKIPLEAHTVLMGDFNAHTNSQSGKNPQIYHSILSDMDVDISNNQPGCLSLDKRPLDSYRQQLLQFCSYRNLPILNGCAPGDTQGYFTYQKRATISVIDHGIVSQSIWPCIRHFQAEVHNSILSDHSIFLLELQAQQTRPSANVPQSITSPPPTVRLESIARLKGNLSESHFQVKLQILEAILQLENPDLNSILSEFSALLLDETKKVGKYLNRGPPSKKQ